MNKDEEKVVRDILSISDEYEQAMFNYQERGGDRPKGLEYFKREVEVVKQYAQQVSNDFADYINEHYEDGDDTFSIYDWLEQFKNQER
jgi:hypothetical protein